MHCESTLKLLAECTADFATLARKLVKETRKLPLRETPREAAVRERNAARAAGVANPGETSMNQAQVGQTTGW